jgi:outer membrane immunogenic protein
MNPSHSVAPRSNHQIGTRQDFCPGYEIGMKHWLYTISAAAILASGSAFAADLGRGPPMAPPPVPFFTWTGFYVGADVGYAWAQDTGTEYPTSTPSVLDGWTANSKPTGVFGGGFVGYNWQMGPLVFGLEGDAQAAGVKGTGYYSLNGGSPITDHVNSNTDFEASIRGRLGYAFDRFLVYGTGGVAFSNTNYSYVYGVSGPPVTNFAIGRTGWTAGAGLEYAFTNNWTVRAEYRYADFGTETNNSIVFGGSLKNETQHLTQSAVLFGIAYKF